MLEMGTNTGIVIDSWSDGFPEHSCRLPQYLFCRDAGQASGLFVPMCHQKVAIDEHDPDADRIDQGGQKSQPSCSGQVGLLQRGFGFDLQRDVACHRMDQFSRSRRHRGPREPPVCAVAALVAISEVDGLAPAGEFARFGFCRMPVIGMDEVHVWPRHQFGLRETQGLGPGRIEMFEVAVVPSHAEHVDGKIEEAFVGRLVRAQQERQLTPPTRVACLVIGIV